ncbi:MAG TPA: hypothetical protein VJ718_01715, partial [Candidatus Binataceae bacterium]|nr:hypothetical protein [Candidatus Binataceae bacterium]
WLVPHFEKMLYDNALLARLYLDAARALNAPEFFAVARRTLDYVLREMTSPDGGFYSSQDADSEGEEGKFFIWTPAEISATIDDDNLAKIASRYFDVTEEGNFEGRNILHRTIEVADAARMFNLPLERMADAIEKTRRKLFEARERRVKPGRDDKILAAWNGMMIGALTEGYRALGDRRYLDAAVRALDFAMTRMWDGRTLKRSFKDGMARFNGYLEDYALMAGAMIDAYEASLDPRHLATARQLADAILDRFLDRERGGFFFTSSDHEELITRSKAAFDGSTPSGNSAAAMTLLRLGAYCGDDRYVNEARRALELFAPLMEKQPFAFSHMLEALDLYERGPTDVVIVGDAKTPEFREWIERLGLLYLPNQALFAVDPNASDGALVPEPVQGKTQIDGRLTAYVCRERTCSAPIVSFADLERDLRE